MYSVEEIGQLIANGKKLLLAGDENLLGKLPKGDWIGGSTPYFMSDKGGIITKEKIYANILPDYVSNIKIKTYDIASIKDVYKDCYDNGFSVIIIPAFSETHLSFAINAPDYKDFAVHPMIGWISGYYLGDSGANAKSFAGNQSSASTKDAVVMHIELPKGKYADLDIINLFSQGDGDVLEFEESGFTAKDVYVNGTKMNFANYLKAKGIDTRLPLVADYNSVMINISIQNVATDKVDFYAPVFKGIQYKFASPVSNYIDAFKAVLANKNDVCPTFSCNCILNFLYSELEGKSTGDITGPITFGEIGYQLLNQTLVTLDIKDL